MRHTWIIAAVASLAACSTETSTSGRGEAPSASTGGGGGTASGGAAGRGDGGAGDASAGGSTPRGDAGNVGPGGSAPIGGAGASAGGALSAGGAGAAKDAGGGGLSASTGGADADAGNAAAGGGAACSTPPPSYQACKATDNQTDCETLGGQWGTIGLAPFEECQCFTGQEGCRCTSQSDCLSSCVAPFDQNGCVGVTEGTCSPVSITVGCHCFFDPSGNANALCAD